VIAYKFLSAGAVAPFTGYAWPVPGPSGKGAWVEAPDERLEHGVRACRLNDLAFWLDTELWRAELADPVVDGQRQVIGRRGRLLERVSGWNEMMARSFAEACVWLARERSLVALRAADFPREADLLAGRPALEELHRASKQLSSRKGLPAALAGYLAEAIDFLLAGDSPCAAYICARAAVIASGGIESEFAAERERQASSLAERLGLIPETAV
jgi:hypothetical protein